MRYTAKPPDIEEEIKQACAEFVGQVRYRVGICGLAVVLLEPGGTTSRVVFSWQGRDRLGVAGGRQETLDGSPIPVNSPTVHLTLTGSDGILGAVLMRGTLGSLGKNIEGTLAQGPVERLAIRLENILLQQRLEDVARERGVFDRIGELAGVCQTAEQVYRGFSNQIESLLDFQQLFIFQVDREAKLLNCIYQTGLKKEAKRHEVIRVVSGAAYDLVVSRCQSRAVSDLHQCAEPGWPDLFGDTPCRSGLIVPVAYGGAVVGVLAIQNRLPNAYGATDESVLLRVATLLGPTISNPALRRQPGVHDEDTVAGSEIFKFLTSGRPLEDIFDPLVLAAGNLVDFDFATLAWLDPNGIDIHALRACALEQSSAVPPADPCIANIQSRLHFAGDNIGTLTLWRAHNKGFSQRDEETLAGLGTQVSSAVEYERLRRLAGRQAYQLEQLLRDGHPLEDAIGLGEGLEISVGAQVPSANQVALDAVGQQCQLNLGRELLIHAAHALRTPLTSIKGYSSTLLQADVAWPPELYQEFLQTIDREADRLTSAINDLLGSADSKSSTVRLDRTVTCVESLFQLADADSERADCFRQVHFQCERGLAKVLIDPARMVTVLAYLVRCVEYASAPGAGLRVQAVSTNGRPTMSVGVVNAAILGSGVPDESHTSINGFRDYYPGWLDTGLMLSICRHLLSAHGVDLHVNPPETNESMFWFELPVAEANA